VWRRRSRYVCANQSAQATLKINYSTHFHNRPILSLGDCRLCIIYCAGDTCLHMSVYMMAYFISHLRTAISAHRLLLFDGLDMPHVMFTDHFSGPGTAVGLMCVGVSVYVCLSQWTTYYQSNSSLAWTVTLKLNDLWPRYVACWFTLILSLCRSRFKVKSYLKVQCLRNLEEKALFSCEGTLLLWVARMQYQMCVHITQ